MTEILEIPISKLILLERNPRKISKEQMDKLKASIQDDPEFLKCRPILVNQVNGVLNVYAGNQRVRAAKSLKMKCIPCIVSNDLSEDLMNSRLIKDNKNYGEFDWDLLADNYDADFLLSCGFELKDLHLDLDFDDSSNSIDDKINLGIKYNISIPDEDSTSFENQLDDLLLKFPRAKLKKK